MLAIALSVLLVAMCLPLPTAALDEISYIDENGETQTVTSYAVVDLMENSGDISLINGWNVVTHDVTVSGTVYYNGSPKILLCDGATLTVEGRMVPGGVALTVYGQSGGTGTLDVNSSLASGSGISASPITINGGKVVSRGGGTGAGIGGTVVINGGTVTATGGASGGAGIGAPGGQLANVTINGGTVTATGGRWNPGIGNGNGCSYMSGSVTINGGTVSAIGGVYAAGIGTGQYGRGMNITINGGTVNAQSGTLGDGIGNGQAQAGQYYDDKLGTVTINGGNVDARGGQYGISGTTVTLSWTKLTDAIYAGSYYCPNTINIQKDFVKLNTHILVTPNNLGRYSTICAYDGPYVYASFADYDGSALNIDSQKLATGGIATQPVNPVRSGLTFKGWYLDGTLFDFTSSVENDIKLIAHWTSDTPISYIDENGDTQTTNDYMPLPSAADALTLTGGMYAVTGNSTVSQRIVINGSVGIILADGFTLTAPKGINVEDGNAVTFYGQSAGTGTLVSTNVDKGRAAIGSNAHSEVDRKQAGAITVNGGTFNVRGGDNVQGITGGGAGIGGGQQTGPGNITINGGTITARGGTDAAGIGASAWGRDGTITINGGTVNAYGTKSGSGIGGSINSSLTYIYINGGNVTATGGSSPYASGIGAYSTEHFTHIYLSWTTFGSDSINANKYIGYLHFTKDFNLEGTDTKATTDNINGQTIVPRIGYNVSFVDSDGVTPIYDTLDVSQGSAVAKPEDPSKSCCAFTGWKLNGVDYDFTTPVTQDITLVASWIDYGAQNYKDENGTVQTCTDYTVITANTDTVLESGWYAVTANTDVRSRMTVDGTVNLILCDGVTLNAFKGITVEDGNTLNIYAGTSGTGALAIVETDDYSAGIGSYNHSDAGEININGGHITVYSGYQEAAIGGGESGSITFNGGNIEADGNVGANMNAPDGSGYSLTLSWNSANDIYTFYALVKANVTLAKDFFYDGTSDLVDAGYIPYGSTIVPAGDFLEYYDEFGVRKACLSYTVLEDSDEIVRISTSGWYAVTADTVINARLSVAATNTYLIICDGATLTVKDIRLSSNTRNLTIYGQKENTGVINALGKTSGYAGIGTNGGTVNIYGAVINAEGGNNAAGIGGGHTNGNTNDGPLGTLNIARATVTAVGGNGGAGIGGGNTSICGTVNIMSGTVMATGGSGAAGIGNGYDCTVYTNEQFNITISGGTVSATGGAIYQVQKPADAVSGGAGIGSGAASSSTYGAGTINIYGGNVTANGVYNSRDIALSAGIGRGTNVNTSSARPITVNFSWTNGTDSYYASSYSVYQINLMSDFLVEETLEAATTSNISGKTIIPKLNNGDISRSGMIDLADYALLRAYLEDEQNNALDNYQFALAHVDSDEAVDAFDLFYLDKMLNGLA